MNDNRLNEYEKMDAVKRRADKMERQARMQERLMKVAYASNNGDNQQNVQKTIEVNDLYIEAITAKLKILD